jgi:hypothetical protein
MAKKKTEERVFTVKVIAMTAFNKRVALAGETIKESELTSEAKLLLDAGFIEPFQENSADENKEKKSPGRPPVK